ncbi:hypothetical protein GY543_002697 [Escherichia coli]|nr:hypothetical protein [Escherichia coli]EFI3700562.1 hypothetical protein [Escherichia coli]
MLRVTQLNLFVECWLQCRIVDGFFLMRFLIMYTLMYIVFSGAIRAIEGVGIILPLL